eukprot:5668784-Pleurochrysis_carterae.AAC.1
MSLAQHLALRLPRYRCSCSTFFDAYTAFIKLSLVRISVHMLNDIQQPSHDLQSSLGPQSADFEVSSFLSHHAPTRAAVITPLSFSWQCLQQSPLLLQLSLLQQPLDPRSIPHSLAPFCFAVAVTRIAAVTSAAAVRQH